MEQVANQMSENIHQKQANEQISGKIQELEDCAAQSKEVRKDLIKKLQPKHQLSDIFFVRSDPRDTNM